MADVLGTLGFTQDFADGLVEHDDFELLTNAVRNERNTQDILEYKHDLVERVQQRLEDQIARVESWKEASKSNRLPEDDVDLSVPILCCTLNINRFRFLLKAYWRARLQKIERFATLILDNNELQRNCSPKELNHCLQYFVAVGKCLKEVVLARLPEEFQTLVQESQLTDTRDMIPTPRLDRCVFVKLLKDAGHVAVDAEGQQLVDMKAGDIYIIQYNLVQRLVQQDIAVLI
ncbi:hypothetical protein VOLCADRAFT_116489 [Volvox carteri f. nagariensis]|uniref:DNA replication complex GINS protein SLD5 n=1 Tax=Volvox carteri f. nagariensis TaxID=3068 RepID=D8TMK1_VOLCA|nr:uncharacterized protein VOLCADRAFT_116489 [Volvox carteri f. nagariensis]EFJ51271.1 hypothetical protein VOLCADRAFT_116489 [Volvox carteri f. nagariensis]|eukprot:XP_002947738.1 hypothetical protein VOLCADRAFT_116489 [Volvox carteri f. nagariensis]